MVMIYSLITITGLAEPPESGFTGVVNQIVSVMDSIIHCFNAPFLTRARA